MVIRKCLTDDIKRCKSIATAGKCKSSVALHKGFKLNTEIGQLRVGFGIGVLIVRKAGTLSLDDGDGSGVKKTRGGKTGGCGDREANDTVKVNDAAFVLIHYLSAVFIQKVVSPLLGFNKLDKVGVLAYLTVAISIAGNSSCRAFKKFDVNGNNEECTNKIGKVVRCDEVHLLGGKGHGGHVLIHVALILCHTVVVFFGVTEVVVTTIGRQSVCKATLQHCANHVVYEYGVHVGRGACIGVDGGVDKVNVSAPSVINVIRPVGVGYVNLSFLLSKSVSCVNGGIDVLSVVGFACQISLGARGKLVTVRVFGHLEDESGFSRVVAACLAARLAASLVTGLVACLVARLATIVGRRTAGNHYENAGQNKNKCKYQGEDSVFHSFAFLFVFLCRV